MQRRKKRTIPIRSPRLGLAYLKSLSTPELFFWLALVGLTMVSVIWTYG